MVDFSKMSEETLMQILSRTPPKSLMRFKCIHKSWYSMINDPQFAAKHVHYYNNPFVSSSIAFLIKRPVIYRNKTSNENIVFSYLRLQNYSNGDDENLHFVVEDLIFPPFKGLKTRGQFIELPGRDDSVNIINHCDGIIYLVMYTGDRVLYNPATKEFKTIPESCYHDCTWSTVGFGYDPKCKDYIIIEIADYGETLYHDPYRFVFNPPKAAVYTLGMDSWREVKIDYLETEDTYFWPSIFDLYSNGIFFWFGDEKNKEYFDSWSETDEVKNRNVMIFFDTGDEVFHSAMLPDNINKYSWVADIHVALLLDKSIALYCNIDTYMYSIQIWLTTTNDIRQGGVQEVWTKYLSLEPVECVDVVQRSIAFWKIDEVLMVTQDGRVVLYNLVTGKLKYFPIHGLGYNFYEFQGIICVDSIVSVKGKQ